MQNPRCWMDFKHGNEKLGRVQFELFANIVPKTAHNFLQLCIAKKYKKSIVHRVIPNFMIQMGDYERGDGTGGASFYGEKFEDENFKLKHGKYKLSMANAGPNTNGSQFFICCSSCDHLNGKHVVFGEVKEGRDIIDRIENVKTHSDRPIVPVVISKCGQMVLKKQNEDKPQIIDKATKKRHDSDSEMDDGADRRDHPKRMDRSRSRSRSQSRSQDEPQSDSSDSEEAEKLKSKRKKKRKREFQLESVNFVDDAGRKRKGKGNFKYGFHGMDKSYRARDRSRNYEREQGQRRFADKKYDDDTRDSMNGDAFEICYGVHLEGMVMGEDDDKAVTSLVSTYTYNELDQQEEEEWRGKFDGDDSDSVSRSPSRSPSRAPSRSPSRSLSKSSTD